MAGWFPFSCFLGFCPNDNSAWTTVHTTTGGTGGLEDFLVSGSGRYIQLNAMQSAAGLGYALREFEVYSP